MPDNQQNKPKYQKYRYSIPQLLGLAATAFLPFDLSKFSYDAARAGVIPSLGDCAMSSRKSSASYIRGNNQEAASSADVLVYQGHGALHPDRQPKLPPPTGELQKHEGFAKFLKKHSSPTHNRVTAGGRIVPMEPRSPPPFSLPASATNQPQAMSAGQQLQDSKKSGNYDWTATGRNGQESSQAHLNLLSTEHRSHDARAGYVTDLNGSPVRGVGVSNAIHNSYETEMTVNNACGQMAMSPATRSYYPVQYMGGPVMQQPMQAQQYDMSPYQANGIVHVGTGLSVAEEYNPAAAWAIHNQSYQQQAMQQVMSAHQLLAAWQQHYNQLDQQLKNIDRHRAMHNLDPHLAEQRRVIVQQRSDAKDTVREYQDMLGLKRITDSSQESFATGFNVDAPAYVPAGGVITPGNISHKTSFDAMPAMPVIEKSRGSAHRRAIPIVPPPDRSNDRGGSQQTKADSSIVRKTKGVDDWGVSSRTAPPEVRREQNGLSNMMDTEQQRQSTGQDEPPAYMSESQGSGGSFKGFACNRVSGASEGALAAVTLANDNSPQDAIDEYQQILKAMSQPRGTNTELRQLNGSVMNVEGQGLDLTAVPLPSYLQGQKGRSKIGSTRANASTNGYMTPADHAPDPTSVGKENFSVTPLGHQKAATDAFLAQFNAVEDNMALAAKLETQSLRATSNGRVPQDGRRAVDVRGLDSMKMASAESLARQMVVTAIGADAPQPVLAMSGRDHILVDPATSFSPDSLKNKSYSSVSIQSVHAVGSLPNNFDGALEGRSSVQAQLAAVGSKTRSPRSPIFLRRHGGNGGA